MKTRKIAAFLIAGALAVPAMTACGKDTAETKCSDYLAKSKDDKWSLIKDIAKEEKEEVKEEQKDVMIMGFDIICEGNKDKTMREAAKSVDKK